MFLFFLGRVWISTRIIEWTNQVSAKWDMDFAELAVYHSTPISFDALKQKIDQDLLGVLYTTWYVKLNATTPLYVNTFDNPIPIIHETIK